MRRGIERNVCTREIRSAMYIIPIMSNIRGIITADFDYARRWTDPCKRALSSYIAIENSLEINPSPRFSSSNFCPPLHHHSHLPPFCSRVSTRTRLFSLSTLSIVFCIAHPQASVHYRKYWISIMKYWMISDIRRAADIVRSQYVLAFLAVRRRARARRGKGEIALPAVASSIINMPCWNSHLTEK